MSSKKSTSTTTMGGSSINFISSVCTTIGDCVTQFGTNMSDFISSRNDKKL